jgi:hypothetical protein
MRQPLVPACQLKHSFSGGDMASDLDTVRVLRALFNDMPRAPAGLSHEDTMAWIAQSMKDFDGGETAYTIEHITRNSMLDIVLRLREEGYLKDEKAFEETLQLISTPEGRSTFMDRCIQAQKSADATARLINRAKRSWSDPQPLFGSHAEQIARLVNAEPTGPGAMYAEFTARDDVRTIGVFDRLQPTVYEFDWGFVSETAEGWHFYVAGVWRQGTVGYFERFMQAWQQENRAIMDGAPRTPAAPEGVVVDVGIVHFASVSVQAEAPVAASVRRWLGEVFVASMLPYMAARALDDNYDFPVSAQLS